MLVNRICAVLLCWNSD